VCDTRIASERRNRPRPYHGRRPIDPDERLRNQTTEPPPKPGRFNWNELGGDFFDHRQDPTRVARRKLNELRSLGWTITDNPDGTTTITPAA
jgi:hypothetical protein